MSPKISKAQIQSVQLKLNRIAMQRGSTLQQMLTIFLLERTTVRLLADATLQENLIFKGGYVGVRVYNSPRYTTDLDAVLRRMDPKEAVSRIRNAMEFDSGDGAWFQYEGMDDLKTQGVYGGIGLSFRAGLGEPPAKISKAQRIHIDLGIGDPVTPAARLISTNCTIGEGSLTWQVYPVETILAEKLHAMVKLGDRNSRAKDVYDVQLFLPQANPTHLREAMNATFTFRGDPLPAAIWRILALTETSLLKRGWATAVSTTKDAPQFDLSFEKIVSTLKSWDI
ncbi:MAG: nucleotidyl transferase AbiEii/AbiGii toxin family protein [Pseudomonadota bacterium]